MQSTSVSTYDPINQLKPVADNIWLVDGPVIKMDFPLGVKVPFPTRMVVVRLPGDELILHSPISLDEELCSELEKLGSINHLIASNSLHYWFLPDWAMRYPDAQTYGISGLKEKAKRDIRIDHVLNDCVRSEWQSDLDQLLYEGSLVNEVVFFHRPSRTLIVSDLIENFEPAKVSNPFLRWLMKLAGVLDPDGKMPMDLRMTFWKNRWEVKRRIRQMIKWQPDKVIMAHGRPYLKDGSRELQRAFRWAMKNE